MVRPGSKDTEGQRQKPNTDGGNKEWDKVPGVRDGTKDERNVKKECG